MSKEMADSDGISIPKTTADYINYHKRASPRRCDDSEFELEF